MNNIKDLYQTFKGSTINIFAGGPSLFKINAEGYKGKINFGINYTFEHMPHMTYIFLQEVETYHKISAVVDNKKLIIPLSMNYHGTYDRIFIKNPMAYYYTMNKPDEKDIRNKDFSLDKKAEIFCLSTTTQSAIHIAAYMGAKVINLIGCDYRPHTNGKIHFDSSTDPNYGSQEWNAFNRHKEGETWLRERLRPYGVTLLNLSNNLLGEQHG